MRNGTYAMVYTENPGKNPTHYIVDAILLAALFCTVRLLLKFIKGGGRNA